MEVTRTVPVKLDVPEERREDLRGAVGYVGQATVLFDGTVAENVRYGQFDATRED